MKWLEKKNKPIREKILLLELGLTTLIMVPFLKNKLFPSSDTEKIIGAWNVYIEIDLQASDR